MYDKNSAKFHLSNTGRGAFAPLLSHPPFGNLTKHKKLVLEYNTNLPVPSIRLGDSPLGNQGRDKARGSGTGSKLPLLSAPTSPFSTQHIYFLIPYTNNCLLGQRVKVLASLWSTCILACICGDSPSSAKAGWPCQAWHPIYLGLFSALYLWSHLSRSTVFFLET